jgi:hypothetical protein
VKGEKGGATIPHTPYQDSDRFVIAKKYHFGHETSLTFSFPATTKTRKDKDGQDQGSAIH